jgi:hypothetical protein
MPIFDKESLMTFSEGCNKLDITPKQFVIRTNVVMKGSLTEREGSVILTSFN